MARPLQKLKNHLIYYSARAAMFFIARMPFSWVSRLGQFFGSAVYSLASGERRKTLKSLRTAFSGDLAPGEIGRLGRRVWQNVGRNLFEIVCWTRWDSGKIRAQVARSSGLENIEKALARKKGLFIVSGHLGNWELLGGFLFSHYQGSAIAQNLYDPRFDVIVNRFRQDKLGATSMIKRGMALRGILEDLRKNHFIIGLLDQDTGTDGVFTPFFGKNAWTQTGVARIARKTGAALVPAFMVRGSDGLYEAHVGEEIDVPHTDDVEKDILETVRRYTGIIEAQVRAYPDQWMWMHERWKTRPPEEKA